MTDPATKEDVREVREMVKSLARAIRGFNGTPGLMTQVYINTRHTKLIMWLLGTLWVAGLGAAGTAMARVFWQ